MQVNKYETDGVYGIYRSTSLAPKHDFHVITPDHINRSWQQVGAVFTKRVKTNPLFDGRSLATGVFWSNGWQSHVFVLRIRGGNALTAKQMLALQAYTVQHAFIYREGKYYPRINKLQRIEWSVEENAWLAYYSQDPRPSDEKRKLGIMKSNPREASRYEDGINIMELLCWQGPFGSWG